MPPLRLALPLLAVLALAGCETLTPGQCRAADWYRIGLADGAAGLGAGRIEAHRRACAKAGVSPDAAAWLAGRSAGLRRYCTPAMAHAVGRHGGAIAPGCTAAELAAMGPAFRRGTIWWQIERDIGAIEADIDAAEAELRRLPPDAAAARARLRREIMRLEAQRVLLQAEQRRHAAWPP